MEDSEFTKPISKALDLNQSQVSQVIQFFNNGATLPFIARYRKEATGQLDENQLAQIQQKWQDYLALEKRKATIRKTLEAQDNLTSALEAAIHRAQDQQTLEDLYLPYKPKKQTKGTKAKGRGLAPLAEWLWHQPQGSVFKKAQSFSSKDVQTPEAALNGARDIIAEWINEDAGTRDQLRKLYSKKAMLQAKVKKGQRERGQKFADYFNYRDSIRNIKGHQLLALFRAEQANVLQLSWGPPKEKALAVIREKLKIKDNESGEQLTMALTEAYLRLLKPSLDNEFSQQAKKNADETAIEVFGENLRQKLLAPPLGGKPILAFDPGYRSGCKVALLDEQGYFQASATIYPNPPQNQTERSAKVLEDLIKQYPVKAIAIGDGTASRETEEWVNRLTAFKDTDTFLVNEDGASVYSASQVAQWEHPALDVTIRGAISIGRRLMDPLSELVKIDPKSLGIGQYQHDVDQKALKAKLDRVVEHCVNKVGVNLNTASSYLLTYVSGFGQQIAENIVRYRYENGPLPDRKALKRVPKLGPKAFEQSAGFLRIPGARHPLDDSAVHPESYPLVENIAKDLGLSVKQMLNKPEARKKINWASYITNELGWPTLKDIKAELEKPGRDPRPALQAITFDKTIHSLEDLAEGMVLPGKITNITQFGAFVDIGIKENGLIHVSEMANHYVKDPAKEVSLNQALNVRIISVDPERRRIQLSLKKEN